MPHSDKRKNVQRLSERFARPRDNSRDGTRLRIRKVLDTKVPNNPNPSKKK